MYKVCIIDSEETVLDLLEELLEQYKNARRIEMTVHRFGNVNSYLAASDDSNIILLGLGGMNEMPMAKKLHEARPDASVILMSESGRVAIYGYRIDALGFVPKPIDKNLLAASLDKAVRKAEIPRGGVDIQLKTVGGRRRLNVRDISYIEVRRHYLFYHVSEDGDEGESVYQARGVMQDVEKQLSGYNFIRSSISYLVNLGHVRCVEGSDVYLRHSVVPVSRNYKKSFIEALESFRKR